MEYAKALITDPWGTYVKAQETSDSVDHTRVLVPKNFSSNPTIAFRINFAPKWSIYP